MTIPQLPAVVEPAQLTAALRRGGVLDAGAVREVKVLHQRDTVVSHIVRLGLRYVGEPAGAPQSLILKTANSAFAQTLANGGRREVAYYTQPRRRCRWGWCRAASTDISTRRASLGIFCSRTHRHPRHRDAMAAAALARSGDGDRHDACALARGLVGPSLV